MNALSLTLKHAGKKFGKEWIFRELNFQINAGEKCVILGGNGSGKSTLLQTLSGFVTLNEGELIHEAVGKTINIEEVHANLSYASPYLQLVEDLTLEEMILHAGKFKRFLNGYSSDEIIKLSGLKTSSDKFIKQFSSGMKQRLKITLAILADTGLVLLDEPVSNLDANAIAWYKQMVNDHCSNRTVIVCSNNIADEFFFCTKRLNVEDYKKLKQH